MSSRDPDTELKPCGNQGKYIFTDRFQIFKERGENVFEPMSINKTGIAHDMDKKHKFNPNT